jgi:hypothetical protein
MGDFSVVKFPDEKDAVSVIYNKWLKEDTCYWPPPGSDIFKLAKKKTLPDLNTWTLHKAVILSSYGKLLFIILLF